MRGKLLCILLGVATVGAMGLGNALAEEINVEVFWSGSMVDTAIDTNGDGAVANYLNLEAKGTLGQQTINGIWEVALVGVTEKCGAYPMVEVVYVQNTYVTRYANGDLLFTALTDGSGCLNIQTGVGTGGGGNYMVLGGTGRFAGATGWLQDTGTVIGLVRNDADPANPIAFAALFGRTWGAIYTAGD